MNIKMVEEKADSAVVLSGMKEALNEKVKLLSGFQLVTPLKGLKSTQMPAMNFLENRRAIFTPVLMYKPLRLKGCCTKVFR